MGVGLKEGRFVVYGAIVIVWLSSVDPIHCQVLEKGGGKNESEKSWGWKDERACVEGIEGG